MPVLTDKEANAVGSVLQKSLQSRFTKYCKENYYDLIGRTDDEIINLFECDARNETRMLLSAAKSLELGLTLKPKF